MNCPSVKLIRLLLRKDHFLQFLQRVLALIQRVNMPADHFLPVGVTRKSIGLQRLFQSLYFPFQKIDHVVERSIQMRFVVCLFVHTLPLPAAPGAEIVGCRIPPPAMVFSKNRRGFHAPDGRTRPKPGSATRVTPAQRRLLRLCFRHVDCGVGHENKYKAPREDIQLPFFCNSAAPAQRGRSACAAPELCGVSMETTPARRSLWDR